MKKWAIVVCPKCDGQGSYHMPRLTLESITRRETCGTCLGIGRLEVKLIRAIDYVEPPTESVGEIPEGVFDIFQADNSVIVKSVDEYSCTVLWGPLEFRFKKTEAKDGTLFWVWDEIVGTCWMHVEQMDVNYYWVGLTLEDGRSANIHIGAKRAQVDMHGFVESA